MANTFRFKSLETTDTFTLRSLSDRTKAVTFSLSSLSSGQTRVITIPDKNITLDDAGDSRTPTAHAASHGPAGSDPVFDQDLNTDSSVVFQALAIGALGTVDFSAAQNMQLAPVATKIDIKDTASDFVGALRAQGDSLSANRNYDLPDASGTIALVGDAPASHSHGNITDAGAIGSTSGLPVVTTTSGAVTALALGTANQVLRVNSGATAVEFGTVSGVTTGSVDNAILRADGTGGSTSQSSDINIEDATTSTQNNVAITNQHSGQTNSALVLTPKGTGALIGGAKPDGVAAVGGNARGSQAIDLQLERSAAAQVASGSRSVAIGTRCTASGQDAVAIGRANTANQQDAVCIGGSSNTAGHSSGSAVVLGGSLNSATGPYAVIIGGGVNSATGQYSTVLNGRYGEATRYGQLSYMGREFTTGSLYRAMWSRFLLSRVVTTSTATELFLDFYGTRLTVPSGRTMACVINMCATTSGGEFCNNYIRQFAIANRSGTTALRGSVQTIGTDIEGIDLTNPDITANDTNDAIKVDFYGTAPVTGCTIDAATDKVSKTSHGFNNNDDIIFTSLTGGAGLTLNTTTYWVVNATANDFQVSTTRGGSAVNITTNYTDATATRSWRVVAYIDAVEIDHGI